METNSSRQEESELNGGAYLSQHRWLTAWSSSGRLLFAAAVFHLFVTVSVYGLGHFKILPGTFDTNGVAVSFASDVIELRDRVAGLSDLLRHGQLREWLGANNPLHLILYSISFLFLRPLFGDTILSAELLNLACYLAILVIVFSLGKEIFSRNVGLMAAAAVGLWPSLLLHTTQLLKDPLFLAGMLAFILVNVRFITREFSWRRAFLNAVIGGLLSLFVWIVRDSMGEMVLAIGIFAGIALIVRQWLARRFQAATLVGMATLIILSVGLTRLAPDSKPSPANSGIGRPGPGLTKCMPDGIIAAALGTWEERSSYPWIRIPNRLAKVRQRFEYEAHGSRSRIDDNVQLLSPADFLRYVPRATVIGFFAPFPKMWFASRNHVGSAGLLLSGMETLAMYLIEGLAVVALWRKRRCLSVWFLASIAVLGISSLGLVVVNVGTLYRLRYIFLILLIILASEGAMQIFEWRKLKASGQERALNG